MLIPDRKVPEMLPAFVGIPYIHVGQSDGRGCSPANSSFLSAHRLFTAAKPNDARARYFNHFSHFTNGADKGIELGCRPS